MTFQRAAERWMIDGAHKTARSQAIEAGIVAQLERHLRFAQVDQIHGDDVRALRSKFLERGLKPSTINRRLGVLRAILRDALGVNAPQVQLLKEPARRVTWLTRQQADRLVRLLPDHLADLAEFSLQTGLRRSNATHLRWCDVDLRNRLAWIHADEAKSHSALLVPLSVTACNVVKRRVGRHSIYVFTYRSRPITKTCTNVWHKAVQNIGMKGLRWHDLRHTWASWHAQAGTQLYALQRLGGRFQLPSATLSEEVLHVESIRASKR